MPVVLRHWHVAELEGLTPEAEVAREGLIAQIERTGRVAQRLQDRAARPARAERAVDRASV